jgi:hypothetical protein
MGKEVVTIVRQDNREVQFGQDGMETDQIKYHESPALVMPPSGDI